MSEMLRNFCGVAEGVGVGGFEVLACVSSTYGFATLRSRSRDTFQPQGAARYSFHPFTLQRFQPMIRRPVGRSGEIESRGVPVLRQGQLPLKRCAGNDFG